MTALSPVILTGLLAIVAKNIVETIKHLANVGGDANPKYTPIKGLYALGAPLILAGLAAIAQQNGVAINLLSTLGVHTTSPLFAAIVSGLAAGFAAPEAYDVQGLLKAKTAGHQAAADNIAQANAPADLVDPDGDPIV